MDGRHAGELALVRMCVCVRVQVCVSAGDQVSLSNRSSYLLGMHVFVYLLKRRCWHGTVSLYHRTFLLRRNSPVPGHTIAIESDSTR